MVGRDAAAGGEIGYPPVLLPDRHDGDGMAPQLGDARRQSRQQFDRTRVDPAIDTVRRPGGAFPAVGVARSPDQDDFLFRALLLQGGERGAEMLPQVRFAVVFDDALKADAQVQEFDTLVSIPPGDDLLDASQDEEGRTRQIVEFKRFVQLGSRPAGCGKNH